MASEVDLGGSGTPFGKGFGTLWVFFWALLDSFWSFFGNSKSYLCKALVQDELQEAF